MAKGVPSRLRLRGEQRPGLGVGAAGGAQLEREAAPPHLAPVAAERRIGDGPPGARRPHPHEVDAVDRHVDPEVRQGGDRGPGALLGDVVADGHVRLVGVVGRASEGGDVEATAQLGEGAGVLPGRDLQVGDGCHGVERRRRPHRQGERRRGGRGLAQHGEGGRELAVGHVDRRHERAVRHDAGAGPVAQGAPEPLDLGGEGLRYQDDDPEALPAHRGDTTDAGGRA
jgi:hypothetical protein